MAVIPSSDDDFRRYLEENKYVIVKFYADWSGTCKLLLPRYTELSEERRFEDILFLDVDIELNPKTKVHAAVESLPCFAIYNKGQKVASATIGIDADEDLEDLVQMLDELVD